MCACLSASLCMCNDCEHTAPQRRIRVLGREMSRIQRQKGKRREERWMKATGHEAGGGAWEENIKRTIKMERVQHTFGKLGSVDTHVLCVYSVKTCCFNLTV